MASGEVQKPLDPTNRSRAFNGYPIIYLAGPTDQYLVTNALIEKSAKPHLMRKCFLHIGTHKTGTTSLQAILSARHDELERHGFLYPSGGRGPMQAHHNITMELSGGARFRSEYGTIDDLLDEIDASQNHIVLSSEDFCLVTSEPGFNDLIGRLQERALEVSVVVYFRNQVDFIRSAYFELLKSGTRSTLDEFVRWVLSEAKISGFPKVSTVHYHELVDRLSELQNVHVLPYSYDEIESTSLIPHFLSILGLTPQALAVDAGLRLNIGTGMEEQFTIFYENRVERPLNHSEVSVIGRLFESLKAENIAISAATTNKIVEACAESNNTLTAKYGVPDFRKMRAVKVRKHAKQNVSLEDIFSPKAQYFVYDLARMLGGEPDARNPERADLAHLHAEIISRHHAFSDAFAAVMATAPPPAERAIQPAPFPRKPDRLVAYSPLAGAYNGLIAEYEILARGYTDLLAIVAERDTLLRAHNELLAERKTLLDAHNGLVTERKTLLEAHDGLLAERERLLGAHNGLVAERKTLLQAHNDLLAKSETLLDAHNGLVTERKTLLEAHDGLLAERKTLLEGHDGLMVERDRLLEAHNGLIVERDRLLHAHNGLIVERDRLLQAHNGLIVERDRLLQAHNGLVVERDRLLGALNRLIGNCGLEG